MRPTLNFLDTMSGRKLTPHITPNTIILTVKHGGGSFVLWKYCFQQGKEAGWIKWKTEAAYCRTVLKENMLQAGIRLLLNHWFKAKHIHGLAKSGQSPELNPAENL
ncbi:hypothetical protein ATANTOWER_003616 [Ataeniobius toweri]|uniref:Uncharacterized protein n=1 Tax=Ataeniobius toweri TaxID=208326 RepID=A0ABU7C5F7_9TELE|nr:hypothetical protein [Ataeniobius toweri]